MNRVFLACIATGTTSMLLLDGVFAPEALRRGAFEVAAAATASASASGVAPAEINGSAEPGSSSVAGRVQLPSAARVPTIVATFSRDRKEPIDESAVRLLATAMIEEPWVTIVLEGHSDARGGLDYNRDLSLERAELVKAYLVGHGVDGARIQTVGLGATRPLRAAEEEDAQAENRRVEVRWVGR